jgi:hypothetical protein
MVYNTQELLAQLLPLQLRTETDSVSETLFARGTFITITGIPSSNKINKINALLGCRICLFVRPPARLTSGRISNKF